MEYSVVSLLNGLVYGMLLFMVSAGLTLVFGTMRLVNFAHASFYMLGAYLAYTVAAVAGFYAGLIVAPLVVALIGILIERSLLRGLGAGAQLRQLLITYGLIFVIQEVLALFYGRFPVPYAIPPSLNGTAFYIYGTAFPVYRVFMTLVTAAMFSLLFGLLRWTRVGIIVRAAIHQPEMTEALGHNVPLVHTFIFGLGCWLAGLAGAIGGAFYVTSPTLGFDLGVLVFVVVVVGGLGSLVGALIASLAVGVLSSFAVGFNVSLSDLLQGVDLGFLTSALGDGGTVTLAAFAGSMPVLAMLVVLLVRPRGLMGEEG